ncbi:MAG: hypothetical protein RLZZ252_412 [Bacteroidota bacterium]|jgi:hypothetical protein
MPINQDLDCRKFIMKKLIIFLLISTGLFAQTGIGTTTPNASAKLDVFSTNKGFLPPRVTLTNETDNTTISNPATGLLVYNTGNNAGLVAGYYYWNGGNWTTIATATGSGVNASFMRGSRSSAQTTNLTANSLVAFTQVDYANGQEIALNTTTGQITLAAGRTYRIMGQVSSFTSSSGALGLCWYNETNASWIGSSTVSYSPTNSAAYGAVGGIAEAMITTTTTPIVISFRITSGTAVTGLGGNTDFAVTNSYPWFDIQVISGNAPFNQFNYGDVKTGFQSADHNGWVKLNGRAKSTLSATQQAQATALGIGSTLPNADNAFLVQNGSAVGTVAGSNSVTLAQNQLPNVTYTGQIADVAHGAYIISSASGVFTRVNGTSSGNASGGGVTETFNLSIPLNGGVTQQSVNITPKSLSVNTFIYLGY